MTGLPETPIVREADFPSGLRCGECSRLLREGDQYAERLTGMIEDIPAVMIICVPCDMPEVPDGG